MNSLLFIISSVRRQSKVEWKCEVLNCPKMSKGRGKPPFRSDEMQSALIRENPRLKLIFRHSWIDILGPRRDPALQINQSPLKSRPLQRLDRLRATHAAFAVNDRLNLRIDLVHPAHDVSQRDQLRPRYARDLKLVRLAHINDLNLIATQTTRIQLSR